MSRLFIAALCLVIVGYGIFEARKLIEGPQIVITSPKNGGQTASTTITIEGVAQNIAFLTINDAPAYTDANGHFDLTLMPPAGYNTFTVAASDRFGRRTRKTVAFTVLAYCPA